MEQVYQAFALRPGLWRIEEGGVRMFLFEGAEEALLVDTGFGTGDLPAFVKTLTDKPLRVVNTHADRDHVGCNGAFPAAYMHPAEMDRYASQNQSTVPLPLWEGEVIEAGAYKLEAVLIPGHTPGSIALLDRAHRFLISGDSVQKGSIFMFGPGRNLPAYIVSMEKLKALSGTFDEVYPSHGPLEVTADILPSLIEAARLLKAGKLEGKDPERDLPCKLYSHAGCHFLY